MNNWAINFFTKEFIKVSGVLSRIDFLKRMLLTYFAMLVTSSSIDYALKANGNLSILGLMVLFGCSWYIISLSIRRLHDAGYSGFWLFLVALIAKLNQSQIVTINIKNYEIIVTIITIIIVGSLSRKNINNKYKN